MGLVEKVKEEVDLIKFGEDNLHSGFNAFWASFGMKPVDMMFYKFTGESYYSADHMAVGTYIGTLFSRMFGVYNWRALLGTLGGIAAFNIAWEAGFEGSFDFSLGSKDTMIDVGGTVVGGYAFGPGIEYVKGKIIKTKSYQRLLSKKRDK